MVHLATFRLFLLSFLPTLGRRFRQRGAPRLPLKSNLVETLQALFGEGTVDFSSALSAHPPSQLKVLRFADLAVPVRTFVRHQFLKAPVPIGISGLPFEADNAVETSLPGIGEIPHLPGTALIVHPAPEFVRTRGETTVASLVFVQFLETLLPFDFVGMGGRHGLRGNPTAVESLPGGRGAHRRVCRPSAGEGGE